MTAPDRAATDKKLALAAILAVGSWLLAFSLLSSRLDPQTGAGNLAATGATVGALILVFIFQRVLGLGVGEIGLKRPTSWPRTILLGFLVAILSSAIAQGVMSFLVNPLLNAPPPDVSRFDAVRGDLKTLLVTVPTVWLTSAFPEEVIWHGFLMTRVAKLFRGTKGAWTSALLLTSILFGSIHFYQGTTGMIATGLVGLLYGVAFLVFKRNLWLVIIAHAANHLISFTALYLGKI